MRQQKRSLRITVGSVNSSTNHASTDIDQAIAAGIDAFAMNVGAPTQPFANDTITQLFNAVAGKTFGLFFSFDLLSSDDIDAHMTLYNQFKDHSNYFQISGRNVISSFRGETLGPNGWANVKTQAGGYIIPNLDQDPDYYSNPTAFFNRWANAVDGVFSWETAWPPASDTPVQFDDNMDTAVKDAADTSSKGYIMGLSSLQYKNCCNVAEPYYRVGESTLPQRMAQILSLQPEFAEVITWNDAGESHYIGPCWPEGLTSEILAYGNSDAYSHNGWQPLIGSFANAFRNGVTADDMLPFDGSEFTGAMWYRGVLKSCAGDLPSGSGAAEDAVNYAVVLPQNYEGYSIRISSNGQVLATDAAQAGLNFNSINGMQTGPQLVEVVDGNGSVVASAASAIDVVQGPVNGFCNFNYYVVGL